MLMIFHRCQPATTPIIAIVSIRPSRPHINYGSDPDPDPDSDSEWEKTVTAPNRVCSPLSSILTPNSNLLPGGLSATSKSHGISTHSESANFLWILEIPFRLPSQRSQLHWQFPGHPSSSIMTLVHCVTASSNSRNWFNNSLGMSR